MCSAEQINHQHLCWFAIWILSSNQLQVLHWSQCQSQGHLQSQNSCIKVLAGCLCWCAPVQFCCSPLHCKCQQELHGQVSSLSFLINTNTPAIFCVAYHLFFQQSLSSFSKIMWCASITVPEARTLSIMKCLQRLVMAHIVHQSSRQFRPPAIQILEK